MKFEYLSLAMFHLALLTSLLFGQAVPAAKPAPVDRSAEPQLRKLFEAVNKIRPAHIRLYPARRFSANGQSEQGSLVDVWVGDRGFRIEQIGEWGQSLLISDGATLMVDPLDDGEAITLKKVEKVLYKNLGANQAPSPLFYMLDGIAGFDAAVQKDAPVIERAWPNGEHSIEFHVKDVGVVNVFAGKGGTLERVEYCPIELITKSYNDDPGDVPEPDPGMLFTDTFLWLPLPKKISPVLFDPTPPKGKKVEDQRK